MKNITLTHVKGMVAKGMLAVVAAGAMMVAGAGTADAQGFAIQVGHPYGYDHFDRGFYERQRAEEFRRHEEFVRRQEWEHRHFYGRPFYR